jgi:hypothetical protein
MMNPAVRKFLKYTAWTLGILIGIFGLMQLIPYGRTHTNPPTISEPPWDSPRTRELAVKACFDCHSNHTRWPWYANVAPMSWAVQQDVDAARSVMNFSEWNRKYDLAIYAGRRTFGGNMPPAKYLVAHPEAVLTDDERTELGRGLERTIGRPE